MQIGLNNVGDESYMSSLNVRLAKVLTKKNKSESEKVIITLFLITIMAFQM